MGEAGGGLSGVAERWHTASMKRATAKIIREIENLDPLEREEVARAALALSVPWPRFELSGQAYIAEIERRAAEVRRPGYKGIPAAKAIAELRGALKRKRGA